jgi:hypothetical protein
VYKSFCTGGAVQKLAADYPLERDDKINCETVHVFQDPEGILAPPQGHHITRRKVMKEWAKDAEAKEKAMAEARKELERRAEIRNVRSCKLSAACVSGIVTSTTGEAFLDDVTSSLI